MPKSVTVTKADGKKEEVFVPKMSSRGGGGKISATLEGIVEHFRSEHSDMDCRWVYHSARKPELSNVMSRRAEGYSLVKAEEFSDYDINPFVDEKGMIRVADTVLMKIPTGQRAVNREARQELADAQLKQVDQKFKETMGGVKSGKHRAAARGAVSLENRDHEYEIEQRSKEG